ncbi:MAG: hypothetical protein ACQEW7_12115 [Pseudomonadota bacterium]
MSSRIDLRLRPSATAGLLATLPWLILAGFTVTASISGPQVLLLFIPVIGWFGWRSYQRHGLLKGDNSVVALTTDARGLCCQCADGRELSVTIDSASSLGASFLALKLRAPAATSGRLFTLIISEQGLPGANAPEADFRRLKMWLRAGQSPSLR